MSNRRRPPAASPPSLASLAKTHGKPSTASATGKAARKKIASKASPAPRAVVPRWYGVVVPLLFGLGGVLMVIGGWAVGAVVYMTQVVPQVAEDVKYPLLRFSTDVPGSDVGGYDPQSRMVALAMLGCIPVALLMGALVVYLRYHAAAIEDAAIHG